MAGELDEFEANIERLLAELAEEAQTTAVAAHRALDFTVPTDQMVHTMFPVWTLPSLLWRRAERGHPWW
eukprot:308529-Chlamydomonas_euryale.AAC.1